MKQNWSDLVIVERQQQQNNNNNKTWLTLWKFQANCKRLIANVQYNTSHVMTKHLHRFSSGVLITFRNNCALQYVKYILVSHQS